MYHSNNYVIVIIPVGIVFGDNEGLTKASDPTGSLSNGSYKSSPLP